MRVSSSSLGLRHFLVGRSTLLLVRFGGSGHGSGLGCGASGDSSKARCEPGSSLSEEKGAESGGVPVGANRSAGRFSTVSWDSKEEERGSRVDDSDVLTDWAVSWWI